VEPPPQDGRKPEDAAASASPAAAYLRVPRTLLSHAKAAYASGLRGPGPSRTRRFFWGFALPFAVARAVSRDPRARARYEEIAGTQLAVVFAVGGTIALLGVKHWWHAARAHAGLLGGTLEVLTSIAGAASVVEWIVVALSREYHDELSVRACHATGAAFEPLAAPPRVRFDLRWFKTKLWRRIREALLIASGLPAIALVLYVPYAGIYAYSALSAAWAAYWLAVFAIANAPSAWTEALPRPPFYLRALGAAAKVPVLGLLPRAYAAILRRVSASVLPACAAMERAPYEAAGLAVARAMSCIPGLYVTMRPLFPVAAWHALRAREPSMVTAEWAVVGSGHDPNRADRTRLG
jgi:hypothetical protein